MGYSPSKKQLDLKDFLSKPAKKRPGAKTFGYQKFRTPPTPVAEPAAQPAEEKSE
ncbi:hypothetical protein [Salipiger mangrovisoli]|uniref:Uncharacterized protein n=1 Tax=Salipiger mangrovisoli TaxID=2865933 RepID=A0ABR9XAJ6_9RHOB|nr:hypothetical protein [Salipiger mangrovisoli]MBE9640475.1 hypothetical protein [Salipiger mangrovisoli]